MGHGPNAKNFHLRLSYAILGLILVSSIGLLPLRDPDVAIEHPYLFLTVTLVIGFYVTSFFGQDDVMAVIAAALVTSAASTLAVWTSFCLLELFTSVDAVIFEAFLTLPSAVASFYLGIPTAMVSSLVITVGNYFSAGMESVGSGEQKKGTP